MYNHRILNTDIIIMFKRLFYVLDIHAYIFQFELILMMCT